MKNWIVLLLLLFAQLTHAQRSQLESALNEAETNLYELEQNLQNYATQLNQQGIKPKKDYRYREMQVEYKAQKTKVKELRKEYKRLEKEEMRAQKEEQKLQNKQGTATQPVQAKAKKQKTAQSPDQRKLMKAERKRRKQEIKMLKKSKKEIEKQRDQRVNEVAMVGGNVTADPVLQQMNNKLNTIEQQIVQLEQGASLPTSQPSSVNNNAVNAVPVTSSVYNDNDETMMMENDMVVLPEIGLSTILFPKFATEIPEEYGTYINFVAQQLIDRPDLKLQIEAYTDNSEKNKVSMGLTNEMANNTAKAFVNRGINPNRLLVKSNGSRHSLGDNNTFFGQARNRRVELSFVGQ